MYTVKVNPNLKFNTERTVDLEPKPVKVKKSHYDDMQKQIDLFLLKIFGLGTLLLIEYHFGYTSL